jgi:hypothetical protein
MLSDICGLTFCGLEHLPDGRLLTRLRGHGFLADSRAPDSSPPITSPPITSPPITSPPITSPPIALSLMWSQPDAAVLHRRRLALPQPRRLRVVWMLLDMRAGLALTEAQANAWGVDLEMILHAATIDATLDRLDAIDLDALVLPADPWGVHKLVVRPGCAGAETVEEWEITGDSAEFDYGNLARYPAMLRQRHAPRSLALNLGAPRIGRREPVAARAQGSDAMRVLAEESLDAPAPRPGKPTVGSNR